MSAAQVWEPKHQHQRVQSGPSWRIYITENTPFKKRWLLRKWSMTICPNQHQNMVQSQLSELSLQGLCCGFTESINTQHLRKVLLCSFATIRWQSVSQKKGEKYNWWNTKITSASILSVLCSVVGEPGSCHPATLQQMCHITCLLNPIHTDWGFTEEQSSANSFIFTFYGNEVTNVTSGSSECYSRWTVFLGAESLETEEPWKLIMKKVNGRRPWLAFGPHGCSRCSQPFIRSLNISRLFQASVLRRSFN